MGGARRRRCRDQYWLDQIHMMDRRDREIVSSS
jgi:hypothetical protein